MARAEGKTFGSRAGFARTLILIVGLWLIAMTTGAAAQSTVPASPPSASAPAAVPTSAASYEVTGIRVDVTAENAAAARDKALQDGARQALQQFVDTWVPPTTSGLDMRGCRSSRSRT